MVVVEQQSYGQGLRQYTRCTVTTLHTLVLIKLSVLGNGSWHGHCENVQDFVHVGDCLSTFHLSSNRHTGLHLPFSTSNGR